MSHQTVRKEFQKKEEYSHLYLKKIHAFWSSYSCSTQLSDVRDNDIKSWGYSQWMPILRRKEEEKGPRDVKSDRRSLDNRFFASVCFASRVSPCDPLLRRGESKKRFPRFDSQALGMKVTCFFNFACAHLVSDWVSSGHLESLI